MTSNWATGTSVKVVVFLCVHDLELVDIGIETLLNTPCLKLFFFIFIYRSCIHSQKYMKVDFWSCTLQLLLIGFCASEINRYSCTYHLHSLHFVAKVFT